MVSNNTEVYWEGRSLYQSMRSQMEEKQQYCYLLLTERLHQISCVIDRNTCQRKLSHQPRRILAYNKSYYNQRWKANYAATKLTKHCGNEKKIFLKTKDTPYTQIYFKCLNNKTYESLWENRKKIFTVTKNYSYIYVASGDRNSFLRIKLYADITKKWIIYSWPFHILRCFQ